MISYHAAFESVPFVLTLLHFAICVSGEVFYAPVSNKMTFEEASMECKRRKAVLATPGQLHAAWRQGLDRCDYGWLSDGSARHPVSVPRIQCGGGLIGVRTMYRYRNQTGFPEPTKKLGAYCFKGKFTYIMLLSEDLQYVTEKKTSPAYGGSYGVYAYSLV